MKKVGHIPVVLIELEDEDLYKFITGGLNGLNGLISGKVSVTGDMLLAQQLEYVFVKTGGQDKLKDFLIKSTSGHIKAML
jgi:putative sterol carrier protein